MACEAECLTKNACSSPILPPAGAVFAPYVIVGFKGAENTEYITVGNNSSPDGHAVIKSFEYGFSDGAGVKLEIIDEEGSNLSTFVHRLSKTVCNANRDYGMFVDFGWIITNCNGDVQVQLASMYGGKFYFLPVSVDIAYEGSKIKYTLEGTDLQGRVSDNRIEKSEGTEDNKKPLKQAIKDMFAASCPPIENVKFEKVDGTTWDFKNSDGGPNGPAAVWTSDQQNSLATSRKWLDQVTTKDGKGVVFQWNPNEANPTLVILEDPNAGPNENRSCCAQNIGTYIVNGGNCSSVLGFTPTIKAMLAYKTGSGGGQGGVDGAGVKAKGRAGSNNEHFGVQTGFTIPQNAMEWRWVGDQNKKGAEAEGANSDAVSFREIPQSIEAELKLVGDPKLAFPLGSGLGLVGKTVSIIAFNPFYLTGKQGCEWIAQPPCNEILTNRNWQIASANHQIKEGSYVTTLKLKLGLPGVDLESGMPLGACGRVKFNNDKSNGGTNGDF